MRDLIHWISQYIEMTWYNERLYILRDTMYWGQNLKTEKKKDFDLNTFNLSIYEVSPCIKSSQYIERFNVSSLSLHQVISMHQKISTLNLAPTVYLKQQGRHPANSCEKSWIFLNLFQFVWIWLNLLEYYLLSRFLLMHYGQTDRRTKPLIKLLYAANKGAFLR